MYLYERPTWPKFSWDDEKLSLLLTKLRHEQGRFIGGMESVGFVDATTAMIEATTLDVVKTSEIEGEILDPSSVRSSIARHLGIEQGAHKEIDRNVEGIVEVVLDATKNYDKPLRKERLFMWHSTLFSDGIGRFSKINVGGWRKAGVQVISGHYGNETVYFQGPDADVVDREMSLFLDFFNQENEMDLVLKSALMHLWFVTIHPFDDGNGRISRAVADMLLARSEKSSRRFYSLSSQIQSERKSYYFILEKIQKGDMDISLWMEWFLTVLGRAIENAKLVLGKILNKSKIWDELKKMPLNERQKLMVNRLLDGFEGKLTTSKWAKIAKCSQDSAYRDILELINLGVLSKSSEGGRSTGYYLIILPVCDNIP